MTQVSGLEAAIESSVKVMNASPLGMSSTFPSATHMRIVQLTKQDVKINFSLMLHSSETWKVSKGVRIT